MGLAHHVTVPSPRRKFLDEHIYEKLYAASNPFTNALFKQLVKQREDLSMQALGKVQQLFIEALKKSGEYKTAAAVVDTLNRPVKGMPMTALERRKSMKIHAGDMDDYGIFASRHGAMEPIQTPGKFAKGKGGGAGGDPIDALPYGAHHIEPEGFEPKENDDGGDGFFMRMIKNAKRIKKELEMLSEGGVEAQTMSNDPGTSTIIMTPVFICR
jgi:hypothetical protein